jgi:hypothetical protein
MIAPEDDDWGYLSTITKFSSQTIEVPKMSARLSRLSKVTIIEDIEFSAARFRDKSGERYQLPLKSGRTSLG